MQMILESDAVLDVKSNMSTVEDIQNHKKECHDIIEDSIKMLNSLNKNIEDNTDAKDKPVRDIENDLASKHIDNQDNEADNSNPDLSDLISDQNNLESTNVDDNDMGEGHLEKEIINKPEELVEDDCLEDDIISIRMESFPSVSETLSNTEKDITENDEEILLEEKLPNENTIEKDKEIIDLSDDQNICDLPSEKPTETSIETETEVIESKKTKHVGDYCEEGIKILVNEKAEEFKKEAIIDTIICPKETEAHSQKQSESMESIDKEVFTGQCDEETEKEIQENLKAEHLAKTDLSCQQTQVNEEAEIITVKEAIDQCNVPCSVETQAQEAMQIEEVISENELAVSTRKLDTGTEVQGEIDEVRLAEETILAKKRFANVSKKAEEMNVVELIEKSNDTPISYEKDTEAEVMEVDDCDEITDQVATTDDPDVQKLENESESLEGNSNKAIKIKESQSGSCLQTEGLIKSDENEKSDVLITNESSAPSENKLDSIGEVKQNVNNLQEKDASANTDSSVEEVQVTNENKTVTINEVICTSDQCEDKSTISTDAAKLSTKVVPDECENRTSSPIKIDATITKSTSTTPCENETSSSDETKTEKSNTDKIDSPEVLKNVSVSKEDVIETKDNLEPMSVDVEEVVEDTSKAMADVNKLSSSNSTVENAVPSQSSTVSVNKKDNFITCKSSYTLDIFSDEEDLPEEKSKVETPKIEYGKVKQCFNIDDDDDIMLIDEDTNKPDEKMAKETDNKNEITKTPATENTDKGPVQENCNVLNKNDQQEIATPVIDMKDTTQKIDINEKVNENKTEKPIVQGSLLPANFLSTAKTKLADMTRDDLEEFCILKIVESIVDRSSLSDIKNKLKEMGQGLEEYRKKAAMLSKQNRDLQVVLKSVQEEQKKVNRDKPITPLKITRSVGVQVYMEKTITRKKLPQQNVNNKNINPPQNKNPNPVRVATPTKIANQNIPVPRLVPANNPALKTPSTIPQMNTPNKNPNPPNGIVRNPSPSLKAEKRPHNKMASNETVDLTDDEPPAKLPGGPKASPAPPVRLVPSQNLMAPQRQPFPQGMNSPRKVYIPISGPPNQALRPGQTIMLKSVPNAGMRPRGPTPRMESMRMNRILSRHPAPLPYATKQYQPPNWKSLPPAPDLKLSKVENGIVISWKIEDVPEDSYEEIASYQLFAYQETSSPASTTLWKKIGDVKALPLPMACTLTQFMAGFKYYFAVRAVDIRSRLGPFSLPGSILLLNKNILD